MYGYDLISGVGPACAMSTILLTASFFFLNLIQYWWCGMPRDEASWDKLPVISWLRKNGKWEQIETTGTYANYYNRCDYTYKWITASKGMGFIQDDPPIECTVLCSTGMRLAVDEILKDVHKGQYN